jgi:hypothetical protein
VKDKGEDAYNELVEEAIGVLTARGAKILWLGMMPGGKTAEDAAVMDPIFRTLPDRHPGVVAFGSIGSALATPVGTYPRWIPGDDGRLLLARKPDGWHLCPDGAARVARAVTARTFELGWSPAPDLGWQEGFWRGNDRYDDPKGGCDPSRSENAPPSGG